MHRNVERQRAQELREVGFIRRPHQRLRRATDAEPGERRQRRVGLHAPTQRRQRVERNAGADRAIMLRRGPHPGEGSRAALRRAIAALPLCSVAPVRRRAVPRPTA